MSFWCSVYLYVPIERLAVALRDGGVRPAEREGTVMVRLPTHDAVSLPLLGDDPVASLTIGCRSCLQLAPWGSFWFPVDDVIREDAGASSMINADHAVSMWGLGGVSRVGRMPRSEYQAANASASLSNHTL